MRIFLRIALLIVVMSSVQSCFYGRGDDNYVQPSKYVPIVMKRADFERSLAVEKPQAMKNAGKIYIKDQWIFISDTNKGFHVYDNSNPQNPVLKSFIKAPGATDLTIKGNVFYINQAVDLVALEINPETGTLQQLKRVKNTFPERKAPNGEMIMAREGDVIVDWKIR